MITKDVVEKLLEEQENNNLEFKAVLPPSRLLAKLISSFANTEGGYLLLGVLGTNDIKGLSGDFYATDTVHKAIDLLNPKPIVNYEYLDIGGKRVFAIKVDKSDSDIFFGDEKYIRKDAKTILFGKEKESFSSTKYPKLSEIYSRLIENSENSTESKKKYFGHIQSILKIMDDLERILYPESINTPTSNQEGRILSRILYSSFADNFETYLSDLLYEIFLAKPQTLKSEQTVTIKEVLNCTDLQDFIEYWAKQKISKLQKGSVKGFIEDTPQIKQLKVLEKNEIKEIDKLLQIRHLYAHKNGMIDDKFLSFYPESGELNSEYIMPISLILEKLEYFIGIVDRIDISAIAKYSLTR